MALGLPGEDFAVFCDAAGDAPAPHPEGGGLKGAAHEPDDVFFREAGFFLNFIEGSAVFPGHAYDSAAVVFFHSRRVGHLAKVSTSIRFSEV